MGKSDGKESGNIILVQFAQWQWANFGRRHLPILLIQFATWQVAIFGSWQLPNSVRWQRTNFDTWQVSKCRISKFDTCQVSNFRRLSPRLEKKTHILYTHRREPPQPRQLDLQLVRQGVYRAGPPLGLARLLRNIPAHKEIEFQRFGIGKPRGLGPRLKDRELDVLDRRREITRHKLTVFFHHSISFNSAKVACISCSAFSNSAIISLTGGNFSATYSTVLYLLIERS